MFRAVIIGLGSLCLIAVVIFGLKNLENIEVANITDRIKGIDLPEVSISGWFSDEAVQKEQESILIEAIRNGDEDNRKHLMSQITTLKQSIDRMSREIRSLQSENTALIRKVSSLSQPQPQNGHQNTSDEISTKKISLLDKNGLERIRLSSNERGEVIQEFFDQAGAKRLELGYFVSEEGSPHAAISLKDGKGAETVSISSGDTKDGKHISGISLSLAEGDSVSSQSILREGSSFNYIETVSDPKNDGSIVFARSFDGNEIKEVYLDSSKKQLYSFSSLTKTTGGYNPGITMAFLGGDDLIIINDRRSVPRSLIGAGSITLLDGEKNRRLAFTAFDDGEAKIYGLNLNDRAVFDIGTTADGKLDVFLPSSQ